MSGSIEVEGLLLTSIAASAEPSRLSTRITLAPRTNTTSTASITPGGSTFSSDTTVLGGALLGLSKTGKSLSIDITLPPSKTSFIHSIETVESQLENFLKEIGESSTNPPSCGSTRFKSRLKRRSLLGDLISSVLCDLTSLKGWLIMEPPNIPSIGPALDKIGAVGGTIEEGGGEEDDQDKTLSDDDNHTRSPGTGLYSTISATTLSSQIPSSSSILSSTLSSTSINDTLDPSVVTGFPLTISVPTMVANALSDALFVMLASEFGTEISGLTTSIANTSTKSIAATGASTISHSFSARLSITSAIASDMVDLGTRLSTSSAPTTRSPLAVSTPPSNCLANNCPVNTIAANIVNALYLAALSESANPVVRSQTRISAVPTSSLNPPQSTTLPAAFPAVESYNVKGSTLCSSIGAQTCRIAYSFYNPDYFYLDYTAYVADSASSIVNAVFGPFASNGCTAMLKCKPSATGLFGKQIIAAFDYLFSQPGFGVCGSIYLANGCLLTLNACNDCKASVPCGALPVIDQPDQGGTYPCYFPDGRTWPL